MKLNGIFAVIAVAGLVAACGQQEEMTLVSPQPTFDKYGNGACEEGYTYVPGAVPEMPCVPDDGCDPTFDSTGAPNDCLPPPRREGDGHSEGGSGRGTPGTATGARP